MALDDRPPSAAKITVALFPGDDHPTRLEMASTLGSSTAWKVVQSLTAVGLQGGGYRHSLRFPLDGVRRSFRARHEAQGWTAGAYTRTVSAIPRPVTVDASTDSGRGGGGGGGEEDERFLDLAGAIMKEAGVIRTTGQEVGTLSGSTSHQKTLRVGGGALRPITGGSTQFVWGAQGLSVQHAGRSTNTLKLAHTFVMPPGVTLTGFDAEIQQLSTAVGAVTLIVSTGEASTGKTTLHSHVSATSDADWQIFQTSTLSHVVADSEIFSLVADVQSTSSIGGGLQPSVGTAQITYTMPAYEDSY